jgi:UDP-glucose 4-epimerase
MYGPGFTDSLVYKLAHPDEENPVGLVGLENFYRDYVHISDIVQATQLALEHNFDSQSHVVMNVGSGVATSNAQLVEAIVDAGIQPEYKLSDNDNLNASWADISRARAAGFVPHTDIIVD